MDSFWLADEAPLADDWEAQPEAETPQPRGEETGEPLLSQIEQYLGKDAEPDATFFVDSWTMGMAAASESFLRRQGTVKSREHEMPEWSNSFSFPPFYAGGFATSADAAWWLGEVAAAKSSMADRRPGDETEAEPAGDEAEMAYPLTLESARQVLGVAATSTREQIKGAYRRMASRYHPDRLAQVGARAQKAAGDRMASINEAYRLLSAGLTERWGAC